jgi:hypothetical protein
VSLPALLPRDQVHKRLQDVFPAGAPNRNYCTRLLAASTVFTALYVNAVEGSGTYFGPKHVYRFTNEQAELVTDEDRLAYNTNVMKVGHAVPGVRW